MPSCRHALAVIFVCCIAPGADAADPAITAAETSVRLGLTAGYGHYEEQILPQDTEAGALLGGELSVGALSASPLGGIGLPDLYTNAGYDFSGGFLGYRGNLQNARHTPYDTRDNAFYNTVIVRLGFGAPVGTGAEFIPYLAGGYQNWNRAIGDNAGAGEYYQAGLLGGGMRFDVAASPIFVMSASAEGLAVIGGSVSAPSQDFTGDFGTSAEERVRLDADYRLGAAWHAFAGVGLTHYNYTGSQPDALGRYEPLSSTLQVNSMFGVAYGF
jgi:hypothetical protein